MVLRTGKRAERPRGYVFRGFVAFLAVLSTVLGATTFLQALGTGVGRRQFALGLATAPLYLGHPQPASAEVAWAGAYDDPEYPGCKRRLLDLGSGNIQFNLKDPERGRTCKQNKNLDKFLLPGKVEGDQITVDFSPRGGPSKVVGKWDGSAIVFQDGKKWTKIAGEKQKSQKGIVNTRIGGIQFTEPED